MTNIGKLFVQLFPGYFAVNISFFATIVSLFGAGAAPFLTAPAPAPAPAPTKMCRFRRLRLRLRLRLRISDRNYYFMLHDNLSAIHMHCYLLYVRIQEGTIYYL